MNQVRDKKQEQVKDSEGGGRHHTWQVSSLIEVVEGWGSSTVDATLHLTRAALLVKQSPGATCELVALHAEKVSVL